MLEIVFIFVVSILFDIFLQDLLYFFNIIVTFDTPLFITLFLDYFIPTLITTEAIRINRLIQGINLAEVVIKVVVLCLVMR